jgi:hypothetical protein
MDPEGKSPSLFKVEMFSPPLRSPSHLSHHLHMLHYFEVFDDMLLEKGFVEKTFETHGYRQTREMVR